MGKEVRSNIDVVIYALARLEGGFRKVPTEKIAFRAFELAPNRFSWISEEFQHLPDKEVVSTALEDAAKPKNGNLVEGKYARDPSKDGWVLTPEGVRWLTKNEDRIASALNDEPVAKLRPLEAQRFQKRIKRDSAFRRYQRDGSLTNVSRFMFTDMLLCSPDAPTDLIQRKFNLLMNQAELVGDDEILDFLKDCRVSFQELLESSTEVRDG